MYVYFVRAGNRGAIKIGIARNLERRLATLQTGNAFELKVIASIPCTSKLEAQDLERRLHKFFSKQRIRGEWFQGNIDFRKVAETLSRKELSDTDTTRSALHWQPSKYKHKRKAKGAKKRAGNEVSNILA